MHYKDKNSTVKGKINMETCTDIKRVREKEKGGGEEEEEETGGEGGGGVEGGGGRQPVVRSGTV